MLQVTDATFRSEVLNTPGVVLVDFWAPWCMPCRMLGPIIERIDEHFSPRIKVVKVNVDENPIIGNQYQILAIPTIMIFKDGKLLQRIPGLLPEASLKQVITQVLA